MRYCRIKEASGDGLFTRVKTKEGFHVAVKPVNGTPAPEQKWKFKRLA